MLWLLLRRHRRAATALALGGLGGAVLLVAAHALTSGNPRWCSSSGISAPIPKSPPRFLAASRGLAFYRIFISMERYVGPSLLLFGLFVLPCSCFSAPNGNKKSPCWASVLGCLPLVCALDVAAVGSAAAARGAHQSEFALCLSAVDGVLFLPPWRGRPLFALGLAALALALLTAPVWQGVHWGPRVLLFALPLLLLDLYQSGRARGWLFAALLALSAVQAVNGAALVAARRFETATRNTAADQRLGSVVICRNQHPCADLAPLWPGREFFTAGNPAELRSLLIEFRRARCRYRVAVSRGHRSALRHHLSRRQTRLALSHDRLSGARAYRTVWRIYELV